MALAGKFLLGELELILKHSPSFPTDLRQGTRVTGLAGRWRYPIPVGRCPPPHLGPEESGRFHGEQWMQVLGLVK